MAETERAAYLAFNRLGFVGPVKFAQLLKYFGSAGAAWRADQSEFGKLGWDEKKQALFAQAQRDFDPAREAVRLKEREITFVTLEDPNYPPNLKQISDPPYLLYLRGELRAGDALALAVVGSRRMTAYGREVIETLVPELVQAGLTIVSGLAFGVDITAHRVALESEGRSVAVLASGVDVITPHSHEFLGRKIVEGGFGALLSELPPGTEPQDYFFPVRNRIISGLALGTLVVEAAEQSGTFYTVSSALEQGREVFAVPGSIFSPFSAGTAELIRRGAKVVRRAEDILGELQVAKVQPQLEAQAVLPEDESEHSLLELLGPEGKHLDALVRESGEGAGEILARLTSLELKGLVRNLGGGVFRRKSR